MKRLLKEPILHFFVLGAAIFAALSFWNQREMTTSPTIVITADKVKNLSALFARTWQRPPTVEERQGLIQDYIREEILYREGMAMGLDRDDPVIRRRLRQKLEFITADMASQTEPSEQDLRAYLEQHPESFRTPARVTFRQIYLNPDTRGETIERDVERLLDRLNQPVANLDLGTLGDNIMLDTVFKAVTSRDVILTFGERFAAQVEELPVGTWHGPLVSGYGMHLVQVANRTPERLPSLDEVRDLVEREWMHAKRLEANETFYQTLRDRYTISIERLEAESPTPNAKDTGRRDGA